jgi:hypothetical protein
MLIDIVVSSERNVIKRVNGKIFRKTYNRDAAYAEYKNETPIPVRAPGTIPTLLRKYLDHIH